MKKFILSPSFQNQLWTYLAMGFNAFFAPILMLITTRLVGLEMAGVLAYAVSVTYLLQTLMIFSVNNYQAADVREAYGFNIYLLTRMVTALFATIALVVFLVVVRPNHLQIVIILLFYAIYLMVAFANVYIMDFLQKGQMRFGGRMSTLAFGLAIIAFFAAIFITRDVLIALVAAGLVKLLVYVAWVWLFRNRVGKVSLELNFLMVKKLIISVFPAFLAVLVLTYLANAQKYYLEAFSTNESIALYSIVILPASMLPLALNPLFLGASTSQISRMYHDGLLQLFYRNIHIRFLLVLAAMVPFLVIVHFLGVPMLSWLYGIDVSPYRRYLMLLSGGGFFTLMVPFFGVLLIIMRKLKIYMCLIAGVSLLVGPLMFFLVRRYGLTGAAYANLVIYAPMTIALYVVLLYTLRRERGML